MRFFAMSAAKSFNAEGHIHFRIEHQCPQCGAPAIMDETDRLFACEFCRVKSYLVAKDVFRYMLPANTPESKNLIYFPYWRFKGMWFTCDGNGITHKFIDVSHQAVASPLFPVSLGLRSQALKLKFVAPETAGRFLQPTQSFVQATQNFEDRLGKTWAKPILHHAHIGETISLIYSPFYIENCIYDAVLNRPTPAALAEDFNIDQLPAESPDWRIHFISTLCPSCGWDLEGKRDSLVLLCKNCVSAWYPVGKKLKKIKFGKHPASDSAAIFLPFWRIRPEISGINLNNYVDLIRIANIPKVIQPGWEDVGFRFWVPAFKVRPKIFLQLSKNMTLSQLHHELNEELPEHRYHPVTLPITEAIESLKVNIASFIKPKNRLVEIFHEIGITVKSFVLVYVPFLEKHHEFIQPDLQFAVNKNILALSENL
jgi:ribosomal protein L37AE/L43A